MVDRLAYILTFLGITPFAISTIALALGVNELKFLSSFWLVTNWETILITYTAVILSFLGGIHWGFAMLLYKTENQDCINRLVIWSNFISLSSWLGLLIVHAGIALFYMSFCYAMQWQADRKLFKAGLVPEGYIKLRNIASPFVLILLLASTYLIF